jgi:7-cyano-7-deazaguanine synthase
MASALVLLSGGMDSAVCLYWAMREFDRVRAITFDYGQEHKRERDAALLLAMEAAIEWREVQLPALGSPSRELVVPNRNAILLAVAANDAIVAGDSALVIGSCAEDHALFPDCRPEFFASFRDTLCAAEHPLDLCAPLLQLDKRGVWAMAEQLGIRALIERNTYSCYRNSAAWHQWGQGCGECLACEVRASAWETCAR